MRCGQHPRAAARNRVNPAEEFSSSAGCPGRVASGRSPLDSLRGEASWCSAAPDRRPSTPTDHWSRESSRPTRAGPRTDSRCSRRAPPGATRPETGRSHPAARVCEWRSTRFPTRPAQQSATEVPKRRPRTPLLGDAVAEASEPTLPAGSGEEESLGESGSDSDTSMPISPLPAGRGVGGVGSEYGANTSRSPSGNPLRLPLPSVGKGAEGLGSSPLGLPLPSQKEEGFLVHHRRPVCNRSHEVLRQRVTERPVRHQFARSRRPLPSQPRCISSRYFFDDPQVRRAQAGAAASSVPRTLPAR